MWPYVTSAFYAIAEQVHRATVAVLTVLARAADRVMRHVPWVWRLAGLSALTGALHLFAGFRIERAWPALFEVTAEQLSVLSRAGWIESLRIAAACSVVLGAYSIAIAPLGILRRRWVLTLYKIAAAANAVLSVVFLHLLLSGPGVLLRDVQDFSRFVRNEMWLGGLAIWLPFGFVAALFLVSLLCRGATQAMDTAVEAPDWGDRFFADIREGGEDPRYRSSSYWAGFLHLFVLVLVPLMMRGCGWEAPYTLPEGAGSEMIVMKMKKIKKPIERDKLILSMDTDILYYQPDPDESDILRETDVETEHEYVAQGVEGRLGADGEAGGWRSVFSGRVRFIRLVYSGGDWDQDLAAGADRNMLRKFKEVTGYAVARRTEQIAVNRLRFFPKGGEPPFVFMTGMGGVNLSRHEARVLRDYCLRAGGMIVADNGGGSFNASFRAAMRRVFPDKEWIMLSNDDPVFRYPFLFPDGAPPLWHHSGRKAVGLRHNGRLICFYHQGDLNDAWKDGHSGVSDGLANQAYKLGINLIYYAFKHYTSRQRDDVD
tara:strand:+ start:4964 stop:6589 length:1626 start_codon:yes stop_codon:yes gene_type:complete